jgi:superfamily II DNA or RNA helicase
LVHATGRTLLGDDAGLGKSLSALLVLRNPDALPALILAPAHLCSQWLGELEISLPWLRGHITAKRDPRDLVGRCGGQQPGVVIASYPKFPYWTDYLAGNVATVIYDEIHELRRGTEAAKGRAAIQVSAKATFKIGVSARANRGHPFRTPAPLSSGSGDFRTATVWWEAPASNRLITSIRWK